MRVTSPSASSGIEWQKDAKNTQNTSKAGKSFEIDCTNRFDKVFFKKQMLTLKR